MSRSCYNPLVKNIHLTIIDYDKVFWLLVLCTSCSKCTVYARVDSLESCRHSFCHSVIFLCHSSLEPSTLVFTFTCILYYACPRNFISSCPIKLKHCCDSDPTPTVFLNYSYSLLSSLLTTYM